jgi:hypothetical protein
MSHRRQQDHTRQRWVQEAARLMVEESAGDYRWAKEKAAQRLGIRGRHGMPLNEEIDQAAAEYARLFVADKQPERLGRLRQTALEAMEFLQAFEPYLAGGGASGTVGEHSPVVLELYADAPESVIRRLQDAGIPYVEQDVLLSGKHGSPLSYPKIAFIANGVAVELMVFPSALKQQKALGDRLSFKQLLRLMAEAPPDGVGGGR